MNQWREEDAVSPVIGVMLMLVVTIIIAAVITGFATDLSSDTSTTPIALVDVDYVELPNDVVTSIGFIHKGGDAILLKDIQITYVNGGDGDGFINIIKDFMVVGKEVDGKNAAASTGDIISATPLTTGENIKIKKNSVVTWTITHTKSGGVIAKGEFVALPM